jgi:hypothetical protein
MRCDDLKIFPATVFALRQHRFSGRFNCRNAGQLGRPPTYEPVGCAWRRAVSQIDALLADAVFAMLISSNENSVAGNVDVLTGNVSSGGEIDGSQA